VISSATLRFPPTGINTGPVVLTLKIKNMGPDMLQGGVNFSGLNPLNGLNPPFSPAMGAGPFTFSLSHKQIAGVSVAFSPSTVDTFNGSMEISSTDPNAPFTTVSVIGKGVGPKLVVGKVLNFGTVPLGRTKTLPLTVRDGDLGLLQVIVDASTLVPVIGPQQFFPLPGPSQFTVAYRKSQQVITVQFKPTIRGQSSPTITIKSNDPKHSPFTVKVVGRGR